VKDYSFKLIG